MKEELKNVQSAMRKIQKFSENTKKMGVDKLKQNDQAELRMALLTTYWHAFEDAHDALLDVATDDELEGMEYIADDVHFEIEQAYLEAAGVIRSLSGTLRAGVIGSASSAQAPAADNGPRNNACVIRPIEPPSFNGDVTTWASFRDLFTNLITNNGSLGNVQRMHYLKAACKGEAQEILMNYEITDANFAVAWEALRKRFENNRIIISKHIEKIFLLPAMRSESAADLKQLIDGTNQSLRALKALKRATDQWSDMLVVHTVGKLDVKTRQVWERHTAQSVNMPTYTELSDFLEGEVRSLEAVQSAGAHTTAHAKPHKVVRTHFVETKALCVLCKGSHVLPACDKFAALSVDERRALISREKYCFNCISTDRHVSRGCKSKYLCRICQRKHHTLLHTADTSAPPEPTASATAAVHTVQHLMGNTLLATALIKITAPFGALLARALIDPGSHVSLVTENVVQQLRLSRVGPHVNVMGVGEASAGECKGSVAFRVGNRNSDDGINVNALVMRRVTGNLPSMPAKPKGWTHICGLTLADDKYGVPGPIDVLLGADVYQTLLLDGVRKGVGGPVAQNTIFGWVLTGPADASTNSGTSRNVLSLHVCIDAQLRQFWEIEEGDQGRAPSIEDAACEQHFVNTVKRESDGRYTLHMPFATTTKTLGESRSMALRRLLQIERRYAGKGELFTQYAAFMDEYLALGHMEVATSLAPKNAVYLAHHAIHKPTSTSTKLRVVFDASQATSSGHSLNDVLMTGPRLQDDLWDILVRWRTHKIALSADVQKMYRQFWIADAHRDFQRILWRRAPSEPIVEYRLKTITYGTSSAPFMAVRAMRQVADDERAHYPVAASVVHSDFYMDDVLTGADTEEAAIGLKDELLALMQSGGLPLLKWSSNSDAVLRTIPDERRELRAARDIELDDTIKTLGVYWHPGRDYFGYKVMLDNAEGVVTKRRVLSAIAKIYDPLALLAPVIVTAKMFLQQLWLAGIGWDDEVPEGVGAQWAEYRAQLPQIESIRIARWLGRQAADTFEIHGFSDASKDAYAACVYMRVIRSDGVISVALVAAKSKVAPIKQVSIPRLELNGAVLLCRLLGAVRKAMKLPACRVAAWTDSSVVLAWLQGHANRWPTFVANRVSFIQSAMEVSDWRHVPGIDNPADVASRGIMPAALASHPLWWCGPTWLREDESHWPERRGGAVIDQGLLEESVRSYVTTVKSAVGDLVLRYSSLNKLLRMTAYIRRVQHYKRATGKGDGAQLQADELQGALRHWVRQVQQDAFGVDMVGIKKGETLTRGKLLSLKAFVDDEGLLRVGGRLKNFCGTYDEKHPLLLPHRGAFTTLVVADAHNKVMHYGPKQTIGQLQQRYWILGVRNVVKAHIRQCVICYRTKPRSQHQLMGDLPAASVTPSRAFMHTSLDYAGPIWARTSKGRGHKANKAWICVFICLASRAIHLELVSDLTTACFIAAFRRFTARRGHCSDIYCDNGTNFVGAAGELKRMLHDCVKNDEWRREVSADGSRFHFAPPGSPHFNGLAEAAVKLAKTSLRKIIGEHTLTFEELTTFLAQAEAVLNSRPIGALTRDRDDAAPLTPGHLLIGRPLTAVPEPNLLDQTTTYACRWKLVQRLAQQFWSRWSTEYVHALQQRAKWQTVQRSVRVGDVVIVRDELLPATKWRLGRIEHVHPGEDGVVRVVSVRSGASVLKRSVVKICLLPIVDNVVEK